MNESRLTAEWDWLVTARWDKLHAPRQWDDPTEGGTDPDGVTVCGVRGYLHIPGVFTRMGTDRCRKCCRATGMPEGKGSPKNDPACRPIVERRLAALDGRIPSPDPPTQRANQAGHAGMALGNPDS